MFNNIKLLLPTINNLQIKSQTLITNIKGYPLWGNKTIIDTLAMLSTVVLFPDPLRPIFGPLNKLTIPLYPHKVDLKAQTAISLTARFKVEI